MTGRFGISASIILWFEAYNKGGHLWFQGSLGAYGMGCFKILWR